MAKDYFNVLKKKVENKGVKLSTLIIVSRSTTQSILDKVEDGYDLIVMGSVSEEVVRKVSIGVMVIH